MIKRVIRSLPILCVDNFIDSLELLKLSLELAGARVYGAVSAEEAIRVFNEHRPAMLISDLALAQGDGIFLLKTIRLAAPAIPAIAVTGISDPAVREQALKAGFDEYLVKPVDEDVLIRSISRLMPKDQKKSA